MTIFADKLANHLKTLRLDKNWSLDELARRTEISRATLSRLENAEVSPTTDVLHRLCIAYKMKMSKLLSMLEDNFEPLIKGADQMMWKDPELGFSRRSVSPPTQQLEGEIIEGYLEPDTTIGYSQASLPGLEHHIILQSGQLILITEQNTYHLHPADCLRYIAAGSITFQTTRDQHAKYYVVMIGG